MSCSNYCLLLECATRVNNLTVVKDILNEYESEIGKDDSYFKMINNYFIYSTDNFFFEISKFLIDRGADVNSVDYHDHSALRLMSSKFCVKKDISDYEFFEFFDYLIERGADINKVKDGNASCLHVAVAGGNMFFLKNILERGADINLSFNYYGFPSGGDITKIGIIDFAKNVQSEEVVDYLEGYIKAKKDKEALEAILYTNNQSSASKSRRL